MINKNDMFSNVNNCTILAEKLLKIQLNYFFFTKYFFIKFISTKYRNLQSI